MADWWRGASFYQVYHRSFFDTDGDGIGDLPGVAAKLPEIASLGVDAVWLSPFYTSPQADFGYDVADHLAVDPSAGTLGDFDHLVATAHRLGLRVMVDMVWSHTSSEHAWFRESRRDQVGPKSDWYVWANPSPDGTPPNNWMSVFGGLAWTWEPRRRQYYLHHFLADQPALNLHNPLVVDEILEIGRFWLDRGVDAFRIDACDWMAHHPSLQSNPAKTPTGGILPVKPFALQEHLYDLLHSQTFVVLGKIGGLMRQYPGTATLGEVSSQPGAYGRIERYTAPGRLDMAYTTAPLRGDFDHQAATDLIAASASFTEGWPCWAFSNHDAARAPTRWGDSDPRFCRMLLAFQLCLRGSVCLYQGEELGLPDAALEERDLQDPFGRAYWPEFKGRDGSRTPMPWRADAPHGGFTTASRPWLPVPATHQALSYDLQQGNPSSTLNALRALLRLRQNSPALRTGDIEDLCLAPPLIGIVRIKPGTASVTGVFNLSPEWQSVAAGSAIDLPPYGWVVLDGAATLGG